MSATIPTVVPAQLVAGDTASWRISLTDYPAADGWALSYSLVRRTGGVLILIATSADGNDHLVNVLASDTASYLPGDYDVQAYATKTTERYQVWSGQISILPNFAAAGEGGLDTRSNARKIFDQLEAAILKISTAQASGASGGIVEWTVEGTHIKRSSPELLLVALTQQRDRYAAILANEDAAANLAAGRASGRRVLVRFKSPQ